MGDKDHGARLQAWNVEIASQRSQTHYLRAKFDNHRPGGAAPNTYAPTLPLKVERNGRYGL